MALLQNYSGTYGGQQFSPYYPTGIYHNFYPFYAQYAQNSQAHGFGGHYPQMLQFPYLPQHFNSTCILSFPSSVSITTTTTDLTTVINRIQNATRVAAAAGGVVGTESGASQVARNVSELNSST